MQMTICHVPVRQYSTQVPMAIVHTQDWIAEHLSDVSVATSCAFIGSCNELRIVAEAYASHGEAWADVFRHVFRHAMLARDIPTLYSVLLPALYKCCISCFLTTLMRVSYVVDCTLAP
jgi:hypothetical protein